MPRPHRKLCCRRPRVVRAGTQLSPSEQVAPRRGTGHDHSQPGLPHVDGAGQVAGRAPRQLAGGSQRGPGPGRGPASRPAGQPDLGVQRLPVLARPRPVALGGTAHDARRPSGAGAMMADGPLNDWTRARRLPRRRRMAPGRGQGCSNVPRFPLRADILGGARCDIPAKSLLSARPNERIAGEAATTSKPLESRFVVALSSSSARSRAGRRLQPAARVIPSPTGSKPWVLPSALARSPACRPVNTRRSGSPRGESLPAR